MTDYERNPLIAIWAVMTCEHGARVSHGWFSSEALARKYIKQSKLLNSWIEYDEVNNTEIDPVTFDDHYVA